MTNAAPSPDMSDAGPRRIAYLTGEYPKASHTFILREAAALADGGVEVETFSIRRVDRSQLIGPEEEAAERETFYVLAAAKRPLTLLRSHLTAMTRSPRRWLSALRLAWRTRPPGLRAALYQLFYFLEAGVLAEEMRRRRIDHLHNHFANSSCSVAMLASEISGVPFSFTMHGPAIFFEATKWALDEKIARARFVSCISHFCRSQAMLFSSPDHWGKLRIVHCGVEPDRYARGDHEPAKRLIFVGRLAAVKGVLIALEALARVRADHPDATLTLVGDGVERARIEARIADMGLTDVVRLTGYLSQSDVAAELARSDVFVLPSFAEGVPVVLMEAMATGLPVVATRVAGIPELVEDGVSGRVVAPGDAEALADAIAEILSDPDRPEIMGAAGRVRVREEFEITSEAAWLYEMMADRAGDRLRP